MCGDFSVEDLVPKQHDSRRFIWQIADQSGSHWFGRNKINFK